MRFLRLVVFTALLAATPASAAIYSFELTGNIGTLNAASLSDFQPVPVPSTSLNSGDAYSLSFTFDTDTFVVGSLFDADPTINTYSGIFNNVQVRIGSFYHSVTPIFGTFQIWDNRLLDLAAPVDAFTFGFANLNPGPLPVDMGGPASLTANFSAFDFTATARTSDLISEIVPLSRYGSLGGSGGFVGNRLVVSYGINNVRAELNAVPEPLTWLSVVLGFGLIGGAFRVRTSNAPLIKSIRV